MRRAITWSFILMLLPAAGAAQVTQNATTLRHSGMTTSPAVPATSPSNPDDVYWSNVIASPHTDLDDQITCSVMFGGRLVVAGAFSEAGGKTMNHIAEWNGTEWVPLGDGVFGSISALTVFDGRLIAGGGFYGAGGVQARHIAAWDGTSWSALGSWGAGTSVTALALFGDRLIAAAGGADDANDRISAWDGAGWSAVATGVHGTVYELMPYHGKLYAAGAISLGADPQGYGLVEWDGTSWSPTVEDLDITGRALAVYNDKLIVAGYDIIPDEFHVLQTWNILMASWDGTTWTDLSSGLGDIGTSTLANWNGELYAGGVEFVAPCDFSPITEGAVVSWDGNGWTRRTGEGGATSHRIITLMADSNELFAGGGFQSVDGILANHAATWNGSEWSAMGAPAVRGLQLAVYKDRLIAEGGREHLHHDYDGQVGLASWDGASWADPGPRFDFDLGCVWLAPCPPPCVYLKDDLVYGFAVHDNRLIINHHASGLLYNGTPIKSALSAWDGSSLTPLDGGLDGWVKSVISYHDQLIAAGPITLFGNFDLGGIAAWNGTFWSNVGFERSDYADGSSGVFMTVYHDRLILNPPPDYDGRLQTWDGSTAAPLGEGAGASIGKDVLAFATYNDQLIAAADFASGARVAAWNGTSWLNLGSGMDGPVYALAEYDGLLIAAGLFETAGGTPADNIAAWDGTTWSPLGSGVNYLAMNLATYRNSLVVSGYFSEAGGMPAYHLAVWSRHEAGAVDVALDVRPGSCTNPINPRAGNGHGRAVVPVAILGSADFDVRDIDPSSVAIGGGAPVRWHIGDVATPADDADDDCACGEATSDGYDDAVFMFAVADVAAALEPGDGHYRVELTGALRDGTPIHGSDCVTLVGKTGGPQTTEGAPGRGFELCDNVPNPFNPTTRIGFYLPEAAQVRLSVYDVLGRRVATLVDGRQGAGEHSVVWEAKGVASGVYYYRIEAGRFTDTKRMVLLK